MTLTTKQLLSLLDGKQMTIGRALGILRRDEHYPSLPAAQREFVRAVYEAAREKPGAPVQHPEDAAHRSRRERRDERAELTPVELAWLDRLPRDPAQVRFDDAVQLATLARSISAMHTPTSARLVESIWLPVKAIHDRRVADAKLAQARRPLSALPASTRDAVRAALAVEMPGIADSVLAGQAGEVVRELEDARAAAHADRVRSAEAEVAEVTERAKAYARVADDMVST